MVVRLYFDFFAECIKVVFIMILATIMSKDDNYHKINADNVINLLTLYAKVLMWR